MNTYQKICKNCQKLKLLTEFYQRRQSKDGYSYRCKLCVPIKSSAVFDENNVKFYSTIEIETLKQHQKQISIDNAKEKYNKNIDFHRNIRRVRMNIKLKQDPLFRLRHNIRNLIRNAVKGNGFSKKTKTYEILGCSFVDFKQHIEIQFSEGMFWENYGEWEYDHITPVSWATTESEIIALNHYTNFQPLWKTENRSKSNKFTGRTL